MITKRVSWAVIVERLVEVVKITLSSFEERPKGYIRASALREERRTSSRKLAFRTPKTIIKYY
jgi:hypothetical protein